MLKLSTCNYGDEVNDILTRFINERLIDLMDETVFLMWTQEKYEDEDGYDEAGRYRHIDEFFKLDDLMNDLEFAKEVSRCYLPKNYPIEKANEAFLELYKLLRAKGEYIPELPMEYVLLGMIYEQIEWIETEIEIDKKRGIEPNSSTSEKIPEPERTKVLNAMKDPYERCFNPEIEEYDPDYFIDQYEDMKNYPDICFWDHDCLMLDDMSLEELKGSVIDQLFDMTGFKDSRHYQEIQIGPNGEEKIVDVSLDDYPWNLEE